MPQIQALVDTPLLEDAAPKAILPARKSHYTKCPAKSTKNGGATLWRGGIARK
jgi:hypothetical protein